MSATKSEFLSASLLATQDAALQQAVGRTTLLKTRDRQDAMAALPNAQKLRDLAAEIKQHTLDHLDYYLEQARQNIESNGGQVHYASDGTQARQIVLDIARKNNCQRIIKSKSMACEEINLIPDLEQAGLDVVESDLGEFVVQISHDRPSHIVTPIIHRDRKFVGKLFSEYFHTPYTEDVPTLTKQARAHLREKFRRADLGMTGGNFVVAQTGQVCVVENEGNARQSLTTPRILISVIGIEKLVPRPADLAVMLKLLARSATGQPMTVYASLFNGPRRAGEKDGPEQFHLVFLDNGRSRILASEEYRETLRCIRCGACLNACPVFRKIGGHAYGGTYPGPIGALLTPLFGGLESFRDLPKASSLCGACSEACPVKIDIPHLLVSLRRDMVTRRITGRMERMIYRAWARCMGSPRFYGLLSTMQSFVLRRRAKGSGWVNHLPPPATGWTNVRDMPAPADKTFHELWKQRTKK